MFRHNAFPYAAMSLVAAYPDLPEHLVDPANPQVFRSAHQRPGPWEGLPP